MYFALAAYFMLTSVAAAATPAVPQGYVWSFAPGQPGECQQTTNNQGERWVEASGLQACADACSADDTCEAFDWSNQACYLNQYCDQQDADAYLSFRKKKQQSFLGKLSNTCFGRSDGNIFHGQASAAGKDDCQWDVLVQQSKLQFQLRVPQTNQCLSTAGRGQLSLNTCSSQSNQKWTQAELTGSEFQMASVAYPAMCLFSQSLDRATAHQGIWDCNRDYADQYFSHPVQSAQTARTPFKIQFVYRDHGYFSDTNNPAANARRRTLEAAAAIWSELINDDFPEVPGGSKIFETHSDTRHEETFILGQSQNGLGEVVEQIDDLLVFVYAWDFGADSTTKASAGPEWKSAEGRANPGLNIEGRIKGNNFEPYRGFINVNTNPSYPWFFDQTPETDSDVPGFNQYDFLTTATHELGHVLGIFNEHGNTFEKLVSTRRVGGVEKHFFTGAAAKSANNGEFVELPEGGSHISRATTYGLARPHMDSYLMHTHDALVGMRQYPSQIELGMLQDIGYQMATTPRLRPTDQVISEDTRQSQYETSHPGLDGKVCRSIQPQRLTDADCQATGCGMGCAWKDEPAGGAKAIWMLDQKAHLQSAIMGAPLKYVPAGNEPKRVIEDLYFSEQGASGIRIPNGSYLMADHLLKANGGGNAVNQYSVFMRIRRTQSGEWLPLVQANNRNSNDAEVFINRNGKIGWSSYSSRSVGEGWLNIAVTVDIVNGEQRYYVNGELFHTRSSAGSLDGGFSLDAAPQSGRPFMLFFADDNGEDSTVDVQSIAVFDRVISDADAKKLTASGDILKESIGE